MPLLCLITKHREGIFLMQFEQLVKEYLLELKLGNYSKRTMETAKKELNIKAKKINNAWYWLLDDLK